MADWIIGFSMRATFRLSLFYIGSVWIGSIFIDTRLILDIVILLLVDSWLEGSILGPRIFLVLWQLN